MRMLTWLLRLVVVLASIVGAPALAQLPWEDSIEILGESLTSVGFWIGVIGFIVAGAIMVFGNDMSDLGRRSVLATLAVSVVLLAQDFIGALFGT